jgi:uncharacterized protein YhbP (UPF0306 family)
VAITRSRRRIGGARLQTLVAELLEASKLCAIATVDGSRAHVNTAYFAWSDDLGIVWISDPGAAHSKNLRRNKSAAVAVYDSRQVWGKPDRGLQLFGSARELRGRASERARSVYGRRFRGYTGEDLALYRCYELRPRRAKLFDERQLGAGVFVTARIAGDGRLTWARTEVYEPS